MGLIKKWKELFSAKKYIQKAMEEQERKNEKYIGMTTAELSELTDEELCAAALYRADNDLKLDGYDPNRDISGCIRSLTGNKRTVYLLAAMMLDFDEGGLPAFWESDESVFAAEMLEGLSRIGAAEHRALYEKFFSENELTVERFSALFKRKVNLVPLRFTPEAFDGAWMQLPPLETYLLPFLREHIEEF